MNVITERALELARRDLQDYDHCNRVEAINTLVVASKNGIDISIAIADLYRVANSLDSTRKRAKKAILLAARHEKTLETIVSLLAKRISNWHQDPESALAALQYLETMISVHVRNTASRDGVLLDTIIESASALRALNKK